ncbi:MAG: glycosyltransferase [Chromatiales bacterium]|nr:glycosyltransferase [Chromatiales bacterium]
MRPGPAILVFSSLFPHPGEPRAGLFVAQRMFRVGQHRPLVVVAPRPWFPLQGLIRRFRPHFRPPAPDHQVLDGFDVYYPRFFCIPGVLKFLDGWFMYRGARQVVARLHAEGRVQAIDAHFAYPDGYAATRLGREFHTPVTITLRGTEPRIANYRLRGRLQRRALQRADRLFAVAGSLARVAQGQGIAQSKIRVIGNGVDTKRYSPVDRQEARDALGIARDAPVLVSVGGLVERKGFHRVIERLPGLLERFPGLCFLIVGSGGPEGDMEAQLRAQVRAAGLEGAVRFLGALPPDQLKFPLSAADVFVLATRNEGWANVFLEAMACGLPVVTTDVGGNAEVVCSEELGIVVPFGDGQALETAISQALQQDWNREAILAYARENEWDNRVTMLLEEFDRLSGHHG